MRCLRPPIARVPLSRPMYRQIHTSHPRLVDPISSNESTSNVDEDDLDEDGISDQAAMRSIHDQKIYARQVNERSLRRWQESKEPKGSIQFMTLGRDFTIPYSLSQLSYMSLNHMRELRSYYRKIMYEMPQFSRTCLILLLLISRLRKTVPTAHER